MKKLLLISTFLSVTLLVGCETTTKPIQKDQPTDQQPIACTMDAKECPNGSYVGRIAPNCEFATCPSQGGQIACTEEARLCPDGSSVARVAPSCQFAPCPISGEETACGITPDTSCGTGK